MRTRTTLALVVIAVALVGPAATAHDDPTPDGTSRCDTWWRQNHTATSTSKDSHEHQHGSDIALGDPAGTVIHSHSGHHVVRNRFGYVEIVGGQAYRGPDPGGRTYEGQGGYAQGEIDPGRGAPDADFHVDAFGPDDRDLPTDGDVIGFITESKAHVCANVAGTRVAHETPDI